jgi:uncharacterized protein (DUF488 family)
VIQLKLFTIGFTKKTARDFFEILKKNRVQRLIDIRLNNSSQLAGFSKGSDLEYFLHEICGIKYDHQTNLAPTEELLKGYQKGEVTWDAYEKVYLELLEKRNVLQKNESVMFDHACLLCSEATPERCHRRLLAEYLRSHWNDVEIIHL